VHVLDLDPQTGRDPVADFDRLNAELAAYSETVARRPQLVAANKIDLDGSRERLHDLQTEMAKRGQAFFPISAKGGIGVAELLDAVEARLAEPPPPDEPEVA
jgi:GTP-binding protein